MRNDLWTFLLTAGPHITRFNSDDAPPISYNEKEAVRPFLYTLYKHFNYLWLISKYGDDLLVYIITHNSVRT